MLLLLFLNNIKCDNLGVGKSSILNYLCNKVYKKDYSATIGYELFSINFKIDNKILKLQIWDTCGQEIYRSLITNFYRNSSLAIVVYSIDKYKFYALLFSKLSK